MLSYNSNDSRKAALLRGLSHALELVSIRRHRYHEFTDFGCHEVVPLPVFAAGGFETIGSGRVGGFNPAAQLPLVATVLLFYSPEHQLYSYPKELVEAVRATQF